MPAPVDPRVLDQLNRDILRENANEDRRERFNDACEEMYFEARTMPSLSAIAVQNAIRDIANTRTYLLPAEMPKCERNSLYGKLDRLARLAPR